VGRVPDQRTRHRIPPNLRDRASELRRNMTWPERRLWQTLRKSQINGYNFRRQYIIEPYIVDFCCPKVKLIIEVDGESHVGQAQHDTERTRFLEQRGYRVLRFTNDDVLHHMDSVADVILRALQ